MKVIRGILIFSIRLIWKLFNYIVFIKSQIIHCINNNHNNTRLVYSPWNRYNNIYIWNFSYWPIDFRGDGITKLYIWNYCAIAQNVIFISADHNTKYINQRDMNWIFFDSIYNKLLNPKYNWPLFPKNKQWNETSKGDIKIDDDVRIWTWAKIMWWVHIWQWTVIAAWAVVTKDIPPYAIAWWVPAKVIKYRFSEDKIKKLLQIDYSKIPIEKFRKIYPETVKEDFDIDYILKKLK